MLLMLVKMMCFAFNWQSRHALHLPDENLDSASLTARLSL